MYFLHSCKYICYIQRMERKGKGCFFFILSLLQKRVIVRRVPLARAITVFLILWELNKNATRYFEQNLEATPNKVTAVPHI